MDFVKNIGKYSQKFFDIAKKTTTDAIKIASKRAIQKAAEVNGDLIGHKIANKITNVSKKSSQNTVKSEIEIIKERYIAQRKATNYC